MATVGSFGIDLGLNTARFEEGLKRAGTGADRFQRGFKSAMVGLAGAATIAAGGVAAIFAGTKNAIDAASAINDASKAAGIAAETYQAWGFAAQLAGVSAESFASAMSRANKAVGDAANGTGAAAKTMEALGISVRDVNGNVISTERVVNQFADAIAGMKSPAEKSAAAAALFGRQAGPQLVAMLEQGSAGMAAAAAEAERLGAVIDSDLIAKADEAGDQLDAMSTIVSAQLTSALVSLTPVITGVAQAFADATPHIAQFFSVLFDRGSAANNLAEQMGEIEASILATGRAAESLRRGGQFAAANEKIEEQIKLMQELARVREKYNAVLRGDRPASAAAVPEVELGAAVVAGNGGRSRREKEEKDKSKKEGQKAGIAYAREFSLAVENAMKESATLDKFAVMTEAAAAAANEWAEQSETAAGRIADSLEYVVFAGFKDGVKGMRDAFNQVLQQMILDLARSKLRETLTSLFEGAGSGGGSGFGSLLGAVVGAFGGGGGAKAGTAGGLKGFAQGGSFTVPGPSTGDNVIPLFRANGGETVTVTPKGGGSGVTIVNNNDFRGADRGSEARMVQAMRENNEYLKRQVADLLRRNRL